MPSPINLRRTARIAVAVVAMVAGVFGSLTLASAPANAEDSARNASSFVSLINGLRTSRGLAPLAIDGALAGSAQSWASHMASTNTLAHDPNLGSAVSGWTSIGENVGSGPSVNNIWNAFVASPTHLHNLLNPNFTHVGVGYLVDGRGLIWTAHRFMTRASAPPPPPAPVNTAPPAPVVTAPPPPPAPVVTAPAPAPAPAPVASSTADGAGSADAAGPDSGSAAGGGDGSGDGQRWGSSGGQRGRPDVTADPDRVAEVIDALRALPA
jgi:hypothetical protein